MAVTTDDNRLTGVRDTRQALEWYLNGGTNRRQGIPIKISGVEELMVGREANHVDAERLAEMADQIEESFSPDPDTKLSESDVSRVVALLRRLDEIDRETRVYGEDREPNGALDARARCYVALYPVTEATTLVVYEHRTPGVPGPIVRSQTDVMVPRKSVEDKLREDVFYNSYTYTFIESGEGADA